MKLFLLLVCISLSGCNLLSKLIPYHSNGIHSDIQIAGTRKIQMGDEQHVNQNKGQIIGHQNQIDQHVQSAEQVYVYNTPPWWVWLIVGILGIIFTIVISFLTPSWVSWKQQIKKNKSS